MREKAAGREEGPPIFICVPPVSGSGLLSIVFAVGPHVNGVEMASENQIVAPGPRSGTVKTESGEVLTPPSDWAFLPAGDGPLTRNVKQRGKWWQVQVKKGRRTISKGIWTGEANIRAAQEELEARRATPEYARRKEADKKRRDRKHNEYVEEFYRETLKYLDFHPGFNHLAEKFARAVTDHATPVGSGTVARTERVPLGERVRAAVIAWMRHQTTAYDHMRIARVKGRRREVRRELAQQSNELLRKYRTGQADLSGCPLYRALNKK